MKLITKLSVIAASVALIGTSTAFAGNEQLQNELARQRRAAERNKKAPTIALYADRHGVGQRAPSEKQSEVRFEWHSNSKGQGYGRYVPVK